MFDIVFQTATKSFEGTNIILSCFAGNLTIFAFGFPYIYRAISNLSKVSVVLSNRIKNKGVRVFYPWFLMINFILNAVSLVWVHLVILSLLSVVGVLLHILYVMFLYQMVENSIMNPFVEVINDNIHNENAKFKDSKEIENDITLVIDLIYYSENNNLYEHRLADFFSWLIDVTILKFKEYDTSKLSAFWGLLPEEYDKLYSTLLKIRWLNLWAVNEKKIVTLDNIDAFYSWLLEYGSINPKLNYDSFPILKTIKSIETLIDTKQSNFLEIIQNEILEQKEQIALYRNSNKVISVNEMHYFVNLLYFILSRKFNVKQKTKYEPCFNIVASMIDNDLFEKNYQKMIKKIQKHHNYFYGKDTIYGDICGFHINILAYLIFKKQYQLLKSYIYYEEPVERSSQHTRPQIPNTINNILGNFIGNNSVFYNTQNFSTNTSSYKYKFYALFILLINSKKFGEKSQKTLSKLNKNDWQYEYVEQDIKAHYKCTIDFKNINFDNLMSFISIENYKDYINSFNNETELLNIFECNNEDIKFIKQVLDKTIKNIKKAQNELLSINFKDVALQDFSLYKQKELKVKNLSELINIKIYPIYKSLEKMSFSYIDSSNSRDLYLNLYDKTYNKRQILSGRYQYVFDREPMNDFYNRLFNILIENCQKVTSVANIPDDIKDNYQIFSNFARRQAFVLFGFKRENIKVKTCIVNGKKDDNSEFADVDLIKINDVDIKISEYNYHFNSLNENGTYPHTIILFDSNKISIEVGEGQSIKFINAKNGNVQIIDNTQIKIKIPNDKSLGYYIVKEQQKQD